ncbi:Proteophosphoglycan ppg4 [Rhodotorula toruloides ATCC 204091]|uniref:Proteophosphoglycan ppg4 n=1 Tax=Rhodotorula toruloides TaxID=5286 RepID=A0A0K3CUA3_RHOTO|nr:Proteophosphoglycan ppg4 [Rhodotorula toruloides ATCC 204091]KAK4330596.1 Proteophosphoglycan ppg4 [Rhodotorula toruloides]PRQ70845.1 Proteophosphoglycan ppg4 [Rhodotorula toruloides]
MGLSGALTSAWTRGLSCAAALVAVQCSIGILFRLSQSNGRYGFSPASSLTLTEFLKFGISCVLFARELRDKESPNAAYAMLGADEGEDESKEPLVDEEGDVEAQAGGRRAPGGAIVRLWRAWKSNLSTPIVLGFGGLAVFYAANNNVMFLVYRLADPGTVQLVKSSSTFVTAAICFLFLGRSLREMQWYALVLQTFGLLVTQTVGSATVQPASTYALLVGVTTISATAGVANDFLCKHFDASLHAENMVLYMFGVGLNLVIYVIRRMSLPDEPGFFTGYGKLEAILLIFLNATVGVVITFVYKYADAIVKGIATSTTTAILICVSILFFGMPWSPSAVVGCLSIFLASWAYIRAGMKPASDSKKAPPPKRIKAGVAVWLLLLVVVAAILASSGIDSPESEPAWHPSVCERKALPTKRYYPAKPGGAFEDILVVVFWNENVYDDNRDAFEAVYGEFFPNMIFVGPVPRDYTSRTADHMLDIWPISSTTYYTHRKLHAVMTEFPCYRGYLWAGFDTFLNSHRLALFDQDKLWNTLPEAEPVLPETYDNEGKVWNTVTRFGPPFPLDQAHRDDWHWPWAFKPCLDAVNASTPNVKERWQRYHKKHFPGAPRLLRAMTDVAYIPHTKRDLVLEATPLFVDCFLEIGLPTFTAIALDEGEKPERLEFHNVLYNRAVNETLIQQVWDRGGEIDAMHQFNWREPGPAGERGSWHLREGIVDKMRQMLREEGERWGVESRRRR